MQKLKKIGIIGNGAIGVNVAYNLEFSKQIETTLLLRDNHKLEQAINLKTVDNKLKTLSCKQKHICAESLADLDLIILPVKQYQLESLLILLSPIVNNKSILLLLHNGMGGIELAQKYCPNNLLLAGITTDGVYKQSGSTYLQTAVGKLEIGRIEESTINESSGHEAPSFENQLASFKEAIAAIHPSLCWRDDIIFAMYQKLAVNAVINPLTALKNCKNGELINYPNEVNKIKQEVFDLYEFMHLPIDNHALSQQIDDVIRLTSGNYSSMHQDFHSGRETEVEGILGFLLAKAEETGMKMDFVKTLYMELK